ncbi:MAG TPA: SRPBCC family protein [Gemmatimonadaceae bacterium]|nr:SRPBCC family protein [Gemmatimonadaceae bacterium]
MTLLRSEVVHASIAAPPREVVAFLADVSRWTAWAPWIRFVERTSDRQWMLETDTGRMRLRFVEPNTLGVLDHQVTLDSGLTVFNSMRVLANADGSELVMVLFQQPSTSPTEFERDVQAVRDDVARIARAAADAAPNARR